MPNNSYFVWGGLIGIVIVLLVAVLISVRTMVQQIESYILGYRPLIPQRGKAGRRGSGTRPGASDDEDDVDDAGDGDGSPLTEVFQRYSRLTDRMADLIFRLTAQKNHASPDQEHSGQRHPGPQHPGRAHPPKEAPAAHALPAADASAPAPDQAIPGKRATATDTTAT